MKGASVDLCMRCGEPERVHPTGLAVAYGWDGGGAHRVCQRFTPYPPHNCESVCPGSDLLCSLRRGHAGAHLHLDHGGQPAATWWAMDVAHRGGPRLNCPSGRHCLRVGFCSVEKPACVEIDHGHETPARPADHELPWAPMFALDEEWV